MLHATLRIAGVLLFLVPPLTGVPAPSQPLLAGIQVRDRAMMRPKGPWASLRLDENYGIGEAGGEGKPGPAHRSGALRRESPRTAGPPYNAIMILLGLCLPAVLLLRRRGRTQRTSEPASASPHHEPPSADETVRDLTPRVTGGPEVSVVDHRARHLDPSNRDSQTPSAGRTPQGTPSLQEVRRRARGTGTADPDLLMRCLESCNAPYDRSRVLYLLGRYRVVEALPLILREMKQPHPWIRMAAAGALTRIRGDLIETQVIRMFEEARTAEVRAAALAVLSRIGTPRCHDAVRRGLWDFEPDVRSWAARAAGRLRIRESLFDIRQAMSDFEEGVRANAAWALHRIQPGTGRGGA